MKQYVIDQLRESDYYRIKEYLDERAEKTVFEEIYQLNLPEELYTEIQSAHRECQPFYFAISLTRNKLALEWLIRSRETLRCECIGYASPEQRDHIIHFADRMLDHLDIKI
ncbi:MAG: hypothetical protein RBS57_05305 [Desulforhabdus sp.]|nr:hypothetical protein [Desulforhabdus sp.]